MTKLNALLQALRHFEFGIKHDLKVPHPSIYSGWWNGQMSALMSDSRIKWLVDARNDVVHASGLDAQSRAHVRLVGTGIWGREHQFDVPPGTPAHDIARHLSIPGTSESVRQDATLVVERRWSVDGLPGEEILDVLADCFGVLSAVLADAHAQFGVSIEACERSDEVPCGHATSIPHPSGRFPCMWAGREARTSRRNLVSGAPTRVFAERYTGPIFDEDETRRRYFSDGVETLAADADLNEKARILHDYARRMFTVDGYHVMIAWLFRDGIPVAQVLLEPERHAAKFLMIERLGVEATRLGADEVILTSEAWEAPYDPEDPATHVRAALREDRSEVLVTHALRRDGRLHTWRSAIQRSGDAVNLSDVTEIEDTPWPLFEPLVDAWAAWPKS